MKKLSQIAKDYGVTYRTAWNWAQEGKLNVVKLPSGSIMVLEDTKINNTAIYCRVSSSENKDNLSSQKDRVYAYCIAKGYKISQIVTEIGSGVNDTRKKWTRLLIDDSINHIVVEHKDRFTRFGFNIIEELLKKQGKTIEVINSEEDQEPDIVQDFVSIIISFCARIYGQRRSKRKTEKLLKELENNETN